MKDVTDTLLQRRSIRRYEREPISDGDMELIYKAIQNTPTSYNGQQFSVVDITDSGIKENLYALTGQKQIKTCSHFMLFLADYHKISLLAADKGIEMPPFAHTVDGVTVGIIDASLAMMSAITMACSLGLGVCPIGYARTAAPAAVAEIAGLPDGVMVVCGLALGVPREMPDLKPKQPLSLVIHPERYRADEGTMLAELRDYDVEVSEYNRNRAGSTTDNDWGGHIVGYYREAMAYNMLEAMRRQDFDFKH